MSLVTCSLDAGVAEVDSAERQQLWTVLQNNDCTSCDAMFRSSVILTSDRSICCQMPDSRPPNADSIFRLSERKSLTHQPVRPTAQPTAADRAYMHKLQIDP